MPGLELVRDGTWSESDDVWLRRDVRASAADFVFESLQPGRDIDSRAVSQVEVLVDFVLQFVEGGRRVTSCSGIISSGLDQRSHAVDRQRSHKPFGQPVGQRRESHAPQCFELCESFEVQVGTASDTLAADIFPDGRQPGAWSLSENFVSDFRRREIPGIAVVVGFESEEVEQAVDLFSVVGLCGGGVVFDESGIAIDDGLVDELQDVSGVFSIECSVLEVVDELAVSQGILGDFGFEVFEQPVGSLVEDGADVPESEFGSGEQLAAVGGDEVLDILPGVIGIDGFGGCQSRAAAVSEPGDLEAIDNLSDGIEQPFVSIETRA